MKKIMVVLFIVIMPFMGYGQVPAKYKMDVEVGTYSISKKSYKCLSFKITNEDEPIWIWLGNSSSHNLSNKEKIWDYFMKKREDGSLVMWASCSETIFTPYIFNSFIKKLFSHETFNIDVICNTSYKDIDFAIEKIKKMIYAFSERELFKTYPSLDLISCHSMKENFMLYRLNSISFELDDLIKGSKKYE